MKRIIGMFIVICMLVSMAAIAPADYSVKVEATPYNIDGGYCTSANFIIDPGHGGSDPGACGYGREEATDVLNLSLAVGRYVIKGGGTVAFTRVTDVYHTLTQKVNQQKAGSFSYFLSIHRNASGGAGYGVETWYYTGSSAGQSLANSVNSKLVAAGGWRDRGLKTTTSLAVIKNTTITAALVEVGFIDNEGDNTIWVNKFDANALGIANGLLAMIGKSVSAAPTLTDKLNGNSPITNLPSGSYIKLQSQRFGTYLTRNSDNTISVQAASNSHNQVWKVQKNSDNTYTFFNAGNGYALDINGAGSADGTAATAYQSNSSNAQKFYAYYFNGGYQFRACYLQNNVLDVSESKQVSQLWTFNDSANQRYTIEKVDVAGVLPLRDYGNFEAKLKLGSGKYLGVNGTNVEANAAGVLWQFTYNTNGTYTLTEPGGKALDCADGKYENATNLQIWTPNGTNAQQFYLYNIDGKYLLKPNGGPVTGEAIVVDVDASTQNAQLYTHSSTSAASLAAQRFTLDMPDAVVSDYKITNVTYWGYDVQAKVSGNVGVVKLPTWTEAGGQDDIQWYELTPSNGTISYHVNTSKHGYQTGVYNTHIHAYNKVGETTTVGMSVTVPVPAYPTDADYIPLTNANGSQYESASMIWTTGTFTAQYWGALVLTQSADGWVVSAKYDSGTAKSVTASTTNPIIAVHSALPAYSSYAALQIGDTVTLEGANVSGGAVLTNAHVRIPYTFVLKDNVKDTVLDDKYVTPEGKNFTASQVSAKFKCVVSVFSAAGVKLGDTKSCGTGCVVKYMGSDGAVINSATVVIVGDINGDGDVTTVDLMNARGVIKTTSTITGAYAEAMDMDSNGSLDTIDYVTIKAMMKE